MVKGLAERFGFRPKLFLRNLCVWLFCGQGEGLTWTGIVGESRDQVCVQVGERVPQRLVVYLEWLVHVD
jgi:hypothetical protein